MSRLSPTTTVLHAWKTILRFAGVGLLLALAVSLTQPLRYSSRVRLLILQDVGTAVDAYTASRSEERIAENLSTVVYTTTFFDRVLNAGFSVDPDGFPLQDSKRRRAWAKTVDATVSRGSGLLTITAYHQDVAQAEQIAQAISFVLTQYAGDYTSGGNVQVRLVDAPLNSSWWVKPNLLANGLSGLFLGVLAGGGYVLLMAERHHRLRQLTHEQTS